MSKSSPKIDLSKVGQTNLYHSDEERWFIDEAISRTTEALQRLREEKRAIILREEELQSDLDRYLSARAPIKRLPDNVLCNIFEWHCQDASPVGIPFSCWFIPPQITISHVCSTWRQIMLDISAFWCSIRLESELQMNVGKEVDVAHAWLSRAKSLPCSVTITFGNTGWGKPDQWELDWHRNIVKDIVSLFKLKKLDLSFEYYQLQDLLQDLLQFPDAKLCCIEDLCLRKVDLEDSTASETGLPFELHKLSSLTSFSLFGSRLDMSHIFAMDPEDGSRFASIPWHQLRHIKIHMTFSMLFCLRILELSSVVLETCSLDAYADSSFMSLPSSSLKEHIHCSVLREFKVDIRSWSVSESVSGTGNIIDPFLGSLRCPKLKSLTVGSPGFILPLSINVQTFHRMQEVSGMHLEELIIYNSIHDLEVLPLLASFPSLRRLVLPQTINFTEEAMDELGSGSIAPFLEDLTIKKPVLVLERLFHMIRTRSLFGKEDSPRKYKANPFKYVTLYCKDSARNKYTDTIKEINKSGVNLTVIWGGYSSDDESMMYDTWYGDDVYSDEDYDEEISNIYE